jgi:hypothetical protein
VGFGALERVITTRLDMAGRLSPLCGMANGGRFMRLPPLAGLRFGDEALFKTGRAGMFGSDDTGPNRSLRWVIGHDQPRERRAHHRVSTPAVARPDILPSHLTDQATGSKLTGLVVRITKWSYTRRYVTDARAALCEGKPVALANSDPTAGVAPTARTDAGTVPRAAVLCPPGPQTPRLARRVQELGAQVLVRGAIAVPSRCPCMDYCPWCA